MKWRYAAHAGIGTGLFVAGLVACATNEETPAADAGDRAVLDDAGSTVEASPTEDACAEGAACGAPTDCTTVDFCAGDFPVAKTIALNGVWGSGPNDVWAVGTRGTVLHGDGTTFTAIATDTPEILFSVWGTAKDDVWVLASSAPMHSTGFANGAATFISVRGSSWNAEQSDTGRLWAGHSVSRNDVWLAGEPTTRFAEMFGEPNSFFRLGDDGDGGAAWHPQMACSPEQACSPRIRAFWAPSSGPAWAVGMAGQAFILDDAAAGHWSYRNPNTVVNLEGLWGSSASDVWAVGQKGTIRHSTGGDAAWTEVTSPTSNDLHAVWGASANDVWAVGDGGTVLHFDGTAWTSASTGLPIGAVPTRLLGIWGSGPEDVWIVGDGVILHRTASSRRHA